MSRKSDTVATATEKVNFKYYQSSLRFTPTHDHRAGLCGLHRGCTDRVERDQFGGYAVKRR